MEVKIIKLEDNKDINNNIGAFIKELREARGISQRDLGMAIGLSEDIAQQHIYKYEKGIIRIPVDTAVNISKVLNIEVIINSDTIIFIPN